MRGQIWVELLIVLGGITLGFLLALVPAMGTIEGSAKVLHVFPYLSLVESNVEQNLMVPCGTTKFEFNGDVFTIDGGACKTEVINGLKKYRVEVVG